MPESTQQLRDEFMHDDDGIELATIIIKDDGGSVKRGHITYTGSNECVLRAITFLCDEWDYSY